MPVDVSPVLGALGQLQQVNAQNRAWALAQQQRRAGQIGALAGLGVGGAMLASGVGAPYAGVAMGGTSMAVNSAMGGQAPSAADVGNLGLLAYTANQQQQKLQANQQTGQAIMGAYGPGPQPGPTPAQAGAGLQDLVPGAYSAGGPQAQGAFGNLAQASTPQYANRADEAQAGALASLQAGIASGQVDPQTVAAVMGAIHPAPTITSQAPGAALWATARGPDGQMHTQLLAPGGQNPQMVRSETTSRGQYDTEIKSYVDTKPYAENMIHIAQKPNPTAADDYSLAFNVQKMLNPGSEVSDKEAEGFQKIGSFDQRLQAYVGQLANGNKFTPEQRHEIMAIGAGHYQGLYNNYSQSRNNYQNIARSHQWEPDNVAPDRSGIKPDELNSAVSKMPGAPKAAPTINPKAQAAAKAKLTAYARAYRTPDATTRQANAQPLSVQDLTAIPVGSAKKMTPAEQAALNASLSRQGF